MAISASKSKNIYASASSTYSYTIYVKFTESSTSVANNTSTISISGYMIGNNIGWSSNYNSYLKLYWHDNNTNTDKLVATSSAFKSLSMNTKKNVSGSITVTHKSDGSLSGYAKISYVAGSTSGGWAPSSNSVSTSTTALTKIARASSISSLSGTYIGSSVSVSISRQISTATHKVEYSFAGSGYTTVDTDATNSCIFTPPLSLASNIPNSTSGTLTIKITTYYGGSQIGSSVTKSITLSVPSSVVPSIGGVSLSRVDNGVPSSWGVYVKGFSKCTAAITSASGSYGSTIKSYYISGGGLSTSSSSGTTGVLNSAGTITFTFTVTDSRGRTASKTSSISVIDYYSPSISVSAKRCTSDGTENGSGTYLKVTANYSIASVSGKNSVASRSVSCNGASNTSFSSGVAFVLAANCSQGESYVLAASITDQLGRSASVTFDISTAERIMNVKANKKGIAFGKFAEDDKIVDFGWAIRCRDSDEYTKIHAKGRSSSWYNGRDHAAFSAYTINGYSPFASIKTINGSWDIGAYDNSSFADYLCFSFVTDTDYNSGFNNVKTRIVFDSNGYISASRFYADSWFRSTGATGWYNETYGGGIYMSDTSYVRVYNGKGLFASGNLWIQGTANAVGGIRLTSTWLGFYNNVTDAANNSNRVGWIGGNGSDSFYITATGGGKFYLRNDYNGIELITGNIGDNIQLSSARSVVMKSGSRSAYLECHSEASVPAFRMLAADNGDVYLGISAARWRTLYCVNAVNASSDRNLKKNIEELDERYEKLFMDLIPVRYMFKAEGSDRYHTGFIAQDVEDSMQKYNISDIEFAAFCKDRKTESVIDENGNEVLKDKALKDGEDPYEYSLRYGEFVSLNTHMIQKCLKEIKALKEEIAQLKGA